MLWWSVAAIALALVAASDSVDSAPPTDREPAFSGRDIYTRVLANRFDTFIQKVAMVSGDRAGRIQETRLWLGVWP